MLIHRQRPIRKGIAATELALLAPVLLILLVGLWEVGRIIMIRNLLDAASREGGRLAASGAFTASNNHNHPSGGPLNLIPPSTNADFEVQKKVRLFMKAAGINTTGATVTVNNTTKTWSYTYLDNGESGTGWGTGYDPSGAADQLDHIIVKVTLPYIWHEKDSIAWSPLNWFVSSGKILRATSHWASMRNVPVTISTVIPTRPLQPNDPIP